ncbi:MAG: AAA family ATPase, partial [Bacteroidota bacterium]
MYTRSGMYVGTDDFADLRLNSNLFVDKSLFIKEFLEDSGKVALITRPRRWGKSLNMNMLGRFLAIEVDQHGTPIAPEDSLNRKLFAGGEVVYEEAPQQLAPLNIATQERLMRVYQGKSPVISLGLKEVKGDSYDKILKNLKKALLRLFETHAYLRNNSTITKHEQNLFDEYLQEKSDETNIQNSLYFLSKLLYSHFKNPVYIFIDEYDTPINSAYLQLQQKDPEAFKKVLELFRGLLGAALKSNKCLKQGLVTGILRIAKANIFSDLNNLTEYTLLDDEFAASYGFTQAEVDGLLEQAAVSVSREQIRHWYNGYTFGGEVIYNPWSIMSCLAKKGKLDHYWIDSGGTALIDAVLIADHTQEDLQQLVKGQSIEQIVEKQIVFDTLESPDGLYSLLLFSGYLKPEVIEPIHDLYRLSVPNYEVKRIYE